MTQRILEDRRTLWVVAAVVFLLFLVANLPWELDPEVDGAIYRLLQESMTNAFRHGGATHVSVRFSVREREIEVMVRDNGRGAEEVEEGIGLAGMRERVERLGGRLSARSITGGFEVLAYLPREVPYQTH